MDQMTYLVMFLFLIALIAVVPMFFHKIHVPAVVALMVVGIVIGPNCLDVLGQIAGSMHSGVQAATLYRIVDALGFLGLVFLMALAGVETNLRLLSNERKAVSVLSVMTFLLPAAAGFGVYWLFDSGNWIAAVVYASLFASHDVGIVFPVLREMGLMRSRFGVTVLSATIITDILSLVTFAVCIQLHAMSSNLRIIQSISLLDRVNLSVLGAWFTPCFLGVMLLFFTAVILLIPSLWRWVGCLVPHADESKTTFFVLVVLLVVLLGELLGINLIVSAFITGIAIARTPGFRNPSDGVHQKLEAIGFGLVIPFLFLGFGFQADLKVFLGMTENADLLRGWLIAGTTVVGLIASKIGSGYLALRSTGFGNRQSFCAGLMTVPQLSATIAAALIAKNLGILDAVFFNAIVVLSLCTAIPFPPLVRFFINRSHVPFVRRRAHAMAEDNMIADLKHLDLTV
ncbi:MAG: cation:proton antiporter [Kiritimatiellia bacterium]